MNYLLIVYMIIMTPLGPKASVSAREYPNLVACEQQGNHIEMLAKTKPAVDVSWSCREKGEET